MRDDGGKLKKNKRKEGCRGEGETNIKVRGDRESCREGNTEKG